MFKSEKNLLSEILRKQLQKFDYIEGDTDRQRSKTVYTNSQSEIKNVYVYSLNANTKIKTEV